LIRLTPIGHVETPWRTVAECPRNPRQADPPPLCRVTLLPEFTAGLRGIEGFSHLILLLWFDEAPPPRLVFTPPFDGEARGVFASRAPWRPNPVAVSVVAFEGIDADGRLLVRHLDCRTGTALLDIKPYLPTIDAQPNATMGWLGPHATRKPAG
jgi:tRNA-Thr(GGU) m(6)t(6)A37 methyltransferase TsaA